MKDTILERLRSTLKGAPFSSSEFRGELTLHVRKADLVAVCTFLRDDPALQFVMLMDMCGVDYYRRDDRYEVVYNLYSLKNKFRLRLKVGVDEGDLRVPSVSSLWPGAAWHEREAFDMYGIQFENHPDLRRIYMPDDFEYHPLRKDFPLMGIPGSLPLPPK